MNSTHEAGQQIMELTQRLLREYNSPLKAASDYGVGFGVAAAGQQLMNATTQGADPNPLLSGLIGAPINRALWQSGRLLPASTIYEAGTAFAKGKLPLDAEMTPEQVQGFMNAGMHGALSKFAKDSPVELGLGTAAMLGAVPTGAATSIYNVATDGTDYDNNLTSALGGLAALAPITYAIMNRRQR
jgi:hypothetical protein